MLKTPVPDVTVTNGDELLDFGGARYVGNFHKTLPRHSNNTGEVDPASYVAFASICDNDLDCEFIPQSTGATKLINPLAGRAHEMLGPDPRNIHMLPAPSALSDSTAAEMVELAWMANWRDKPLSALASDPDMPKALADITLSFQRALSSDRRSTGDLRLGLDLPYKLSGGALALDINPQTMFRAGLKDEDKGPLVSQFMLHDINYGAQLIRSTQVPYGTAASYGGAGLSGNYLVTAPLWLQAQATGKDMNGNAYGACNNFNNNAAYYASGAIEVGASGRRRIATMRDLARFVNRDALHQAYFNAALLLGGWGAKLDPGNPYSTIYKRQTGFGTLGGPNLLALVSEVASRALKVVWRQKWSHRRLRPEAYAGLMHVQQAGTRAYGLPSWLFNPPLNIQPTMASAGYFLPLAFTAGSPAHPAYGAGHATVAGACVTILKAWFDETQTMVSVMAGASGSADPSPYYPVNTAVDIWEPGQKTDGPLTPYAGADRAVMTVGGELNKLAGNIALGRSMGGVHWRSDNTRSLRLGEQVATVMLKRILPTYAERPLSLSYFNFDGNEVTVGSDGKVSVANDPELTAFYNLREF